MVAAPGRAAAFDVSHLSLLLLADLGEIDHLGHILFDGGVDRSVGSLRDHAGPPGSHWPDTDLDVYSIEQHIRQSCRKR
jgi:hypothetical protein